MWSVCTAGLLIFSGFILFNTMMNAGPNLTTDTLPSEVFLGVECVAYRALRDCISDWNRDGLVPTNFRNTRAKWLGF